MSLADVRLHLVDCVDEAQALMRWLSMKKRVAFDTETTGLTWHDHVRLVQIGDQVDGWAIPWERWGGVVEEAFRRYNGEWVAHNLKFDAQKLERTCGIKLNRSKCHDTRVAAHVLNPHESTALKTLANYHIDPNASSYQKRLSDAMEANKWTWATVPIDFPLYWLYGALDTVLTMRLDDIVMPRVMSEAPSAYDLELAVTWVSMDMEDRGTYVNRPYTIEKLDSFMRYVNDVEDWCVATYGVKPGQNASVVKVLQSEGFEFDKKTATGAVALDKEVLGGIAHPLAVAVLTRRRIQKLASTYLKNFIELSDSDGVLHPSINTLGLYEDDKKRDGRGVLTSRMSMADPNLHNLPRKNSDANNPAADAIRECIIARPDHVLLMSDFDQIEARIFAHLCRDPGLIEAFGQGDFFVNVAREIFGDPNLQKSDPRRQPTKNGVYAKYYGAGTEKFAATAGIPIEVAAAFNDRFDQLYPGGRAFQDEVQGVARKRLNAEGVPYVRSPLTRRRYVCKPGKEYVLINYLIQGTAAEVLKLKDLELSAAGLGEFMTLNVHDEVILDIPKPTFHEAAPVARDVMSDAKLFTVPLTVSCSYGESWGAKTELVA